MRTPSVPVTAGGAEAAAYERISALRRDPRGANPDDWRIDWDDGPWPVKLYSGGRRVPLATGDTRPGLDRLLFRALAIHRVRFTPRGSHGPRFVPRRPVPSGGSMYPTEAYLLAAEEHAAYHYDPYRHELTDLGRPCPPRALRAALGLPEAAEVPAVTLVLTNRFWKNFYKYGDFGYRLGAIDVGVVLGRVLRLAEAEYGLGLLRTDFADRALNDCLGLAGRDESSYAVVTLGAATTNGADARAAAPPWPPTVVERSLRIKRSAAFDALHSAASTPAGADVEPVARPAIAGPVRALPRPAEPDLLDPALLSVRTSNGPLFDGRQASAHALSTVLHHTAAAVAEVRRASGGVLGGDVGLCCAVHRVEGIEPGWYWYRPEAGELVTLGKDEVAPLLQGALFADSVNVELAAFTVHVTARVDYRLAGRGVRGYREQQLAVGVAVEAVTLLAAAVGLGSHPLLGFDVDRVDRAYNLLGSEHGAHVQVCVGAVRPPLHWEVSVAPH